MAASSVAYAFYLCKTFLDHDSRFRIRTASDIQATGLAEVTRAEMLPVFGEDIGRNIFFVPLAERRRQLEQLPWIQRATVMRLLPDQIQVAIVERQPVAFVRHGQQIGLVDGNGVLLNMPPALLSKHHYSFPVLTGIDAADPLPSRKARIDLYERLVAELDANGQHYSEQLSEIDLTDPEDARVLMPEQGTDILAHFGEDHFLDRYRRYKAHIAEWRQQYPSLTAVDLRYEQQVVLQMAPGTPRDEASLAAESPKPAETKAPSGDLPLKVPVAPQSLEPESRKIVNGLAPVRPRASTAVPAALNRAAAKSKQERVNELAARMRAARREAARRAASKNKQKPKTKPHPVVKPTEGE
jgi:cell division protein FtsQ